MSHSSLHAQKLNEIRLLSTWLDTKFRAPGGFRFGLDGIIGLIPVLGDLFTSTLSLYIVYQAAQLGSSPAVLARMGINIGLDALLSAIPVLGNLLDFAWKSNRKNLMLLESHLIDARRTQRRSMWVVGLISLGVLTALIVASLAAVALIAALWRWLEPHVNVG